MKLQNKITLLIAPLALAASPVHAALTAYWNFDGNTIDQVSTNAGTLNGSAATNGTALAPNSSSSLSLPVSGSYLDTGINGGLGGTGSFTVLAWINTTTSVSAGVFSYSPTSGGLGGADLRLLIQGNGDLRVEMSQGAGFDLSAAGALNDGNTHMIAAVFNSSTGNSFQDIDLYVDGTFYDVTSGTDHSISLGSDVVLIGRDQINPTNRPFVGEIDDVAIYDEALTLAALNNLATNGIPEPSAALLGAVGTLLLLRRRRA